MSSFSKSNINNSYTFGSDVTDITKVWGAFYPSTGSVFPTQLTSTNTRITDTGTSIKDGVSRSDYARFVKGHIVPSNPALVPKIS
jgi:hypothetical protein